MSPIIQIREQVGYGCPGGVEQAIQFIGLK
jgi:hypothetical protein